MASFQTSPSGSAPWAQLPMRLASWWEQVIALARRAPLLGALLGMAVLGFAISVYLTTVHYAGVRLVCSTGGIVNCAAVTSSSYSVIPGTQLPITIPGMLWFTISAALAVVGLVAVQRGESEPERLRLAHVIWGGLGLAFVFYLVYAELVKLHSICEWCTAVHVLTLLTFFVALYRLQQQLSGEDDAAPVAPMRSVVKNGAGQRAAYSAANGSSSRMARVGKSTGRGPSATANRHRSPTRAGSTGSTSRGSSSRRKR
ncbi:MAG TPA: vitamin K epoxide reductase family protein [Ktedonobacterales bacterium]